MKNKMNRIIIKVPELYCSSCAERLTERISNKIEVINIKAEIMNQTLIIDSERPINKNLLFDIIRENNYCTTKDYKHFRDFIFDEKIILK